MSGLSGSCLGRYADRVCLSADGPVLPGGTSMRHRIAALAGAGVMIAALGAAPAAASAGTARSALGRAASTGPQAATTCGSWRWPVKTGSDATRRRVRRSISYTSVGYLDHLTPPAKFGSYAQNHRIRWPEFRTWQISKVTLVAVKLEDDGDLHLRLRSAGKDMIAEIPRPGCVSSASLWKAGITSARSAVTSRYWVSLHKWHYLDRSINIRGLGFFDEEHDVTGAAPNDIELHPVIYIKFR
jgi:hypothetical protein